MADGTVVVSHFVAINAAVGSATGTDRIVTFSPAHCSRTELEVVDGALRVVALGGEARTQVR
jgi:broad specificity phosphatase PhoE